MKAFIRQLLQMYFVIYTGSMMGTLCFCIVFRPQVELDIFYLAWTFLFSLLADLPGLVFYSSKELSKKQWRVRQLIHLVLLETVLLIAGYVTKMYEGLLEGFCFGIVVFIVYLMVWFFSYLFDKQTANLLNQKIQERRRGDGEYDGQ